MEGQFCFTTDDDQSYIAEILTTFSHNANTYSVFSFEDNGLMNVNVAKVTADGKLEIIKDEIERQEIFEIVKRKLMGE